MTRKFYDKIERLNAALWATGLSIINDGDGLKVTDGVEEIRITPSVSSKELDVITETAVIFDRG